MSFVFVVQNQHHSDGEGNLIPKFDLTPAQKFGTIIHLLSPTARPFNPGPIVQELHRKLSNYTPRDYLLLLGSPTLIGWTTAIAAHYAGGRINLLQWDGRAKEYQAIVAELWKTN